MNRVRIPAELRKMNEIFSANGFEAYLVGGAVRDMLRGEPAADWDLATDAAPADVSRIFRSVIPTGIAHGTVTVRFMGKSVEVTTYRTEHGHSDGRHPDRVSFAATIQDDLGRRDFTMNAIAASLADGTVADPFGGRADIARRCIRTVGSARERFLEDGLRPVRAIRFSGQLGFGIHEDTYSAIFDGDVQEKVRSISAERFRDELCKIVQSPAPSGALRLLEETGILAFFIPELAAARGVTQADARGFHEFDVLDHSLYACDGAPRGSLTVRLAALLHDVGKPLTRTVETKMIGGQATEVIHFHGHEAKSAEIARDVLARLKFSNAQAARVCHLIRQHMFSFGEDWTDAAVRRFVARVGAENVGDLLLLRRADIYGTHRAPLAAGSPAARSLDELRARVARVEAEKPALSLRDLAVDGNDLLALGVPAGREVGRILSGLLQLVLDDPAANERGRLLGSARALAAAPSD